MPTIWTLTEDQARWVSRMARQGDSTAEAMLRAQRAAPPPPAASKAYLVRLTEAIAGYSMSGSTKTVYSGTCKLLQRGSSDEIEKRPSGSSGDVEIEVYNPFAREIPYRSGSPEVEIVVVQDPFGSFWATSNPLAERISFLAKGAVTDTATSFTADNVAVVGPRGAVSPVASAATELTIYRISAGYAALDNAIGRAEWNDTTSQWEAYWLDEECS